MGAFGEKLRKQRELRGIELDAISNTTKISTRMLRALEDERFDQLPGGVFNKGFVRAYARQVGLDEEETVADYLAASRESQLEPRSNSDAADFRAPAAKPTPAAAAPELRDNAVPSPDPPSSKPAIQNGDGNDLKNELRTEDRNTLGIRGDRNEDRREEDRRNQDRRNQDRRLEARRHEFGSAEVRHNQNRRDQDEAPRGEARPPQTRNQDFPTLPDSPPRAPAADPRGERFRQRYPAGDPAPPESSAPIPWGKLALALLLVTLFLAFWNFRRHAAPPAASQNASASHAAPSESPASVPASTPTQPSTSAPTLTAAPAPRTGTVSAGTASPPTTTAATTSHPNPGPQTLPAPAAPAPAANSVSPATSAAGPAARPANVPQPQAKPPAAHADARAHAPKPPASFTLQIRADETTWITLIADGQPVVANETLIAPAHTSVRATREIVVKTGNAAGISFLLNGKAIPAQGNEGEIRTYVFDATGLQPSPQTQPPAPNR